MIIIGEKLNSSIPRTLEALKSHDETTLINMIKNQERCGADYLDINTAICGAEELNQLLWLIELVISNSNCGIMLDSPSPNVIVQAMKKTEARKLIINSVTLTDRIDELLPVIRQSGCGVVALPIDGNGIPVSSEERLDNAKRLMERFGKEGIAPEKIYIDALAEALAVGTDNAKTALETIQKARCAFPKVHLTCGLSNISFGLPKRNNINTAFLAMAVYCGLDSAILDITAPAMRTMLSSALAVNGEDEYCMEYISYIRDCE